MARIPVQMDHVEAWCGKWLGSRPADLLFLAAEISERLRLAGV